MNTDRFASLCTLIGPLCFPLIFVGCTTSPGKSNIYSANSEALMQPATASPPAQATVIVGPENPITPTQRYSGTIGERLGDQAFGTFLLANDGKIVSLDVSISDHSEHYGESWISLCQKATLEDRCDAIFIDAVTAGSGDVFLGQATGQRTLKGYWQVRVNPGMYQGFLSVSLLALP